MDMQNYVNIVYILIFRRLNVVLLLLVLRLLLILVPLSLFQNSFRVLMLLMMKQ